MPIPCGDPHRPAAADGTRDTGQQGDIGGSRRSVLATEDARWSFPDEDAALWSRYPSDKGLGVGCIDIKRLVVETPDAVVAGVRKILEHVPAERVHLTTDCGMFTLPRPLARAKLVSMTEAAARLRAEVG